MQQLYRYTPRRPYVAEKQAVSMSRCCSVAKLALSYALPGPSIAHTRSRVYQHNKLREIGGEQVGFLFTFVYVHLAILM
jgi:hypothetical protein